MTALAIALVLCCAMVCGTVLVVRREGKSAAVDVDLQRELSVVHDRVAHLAGESSAHIERHASLKADVDSLRAQVALRSM